MCHPRDGLELLDEEAFEREQFMPYWADLWPSAVALAMSSARRPPAGKRVIELGLRDRAARASSPRAVGPPTCC